MAVRRPVFTENFSANLSDIQGFLGVAGAKLFDRFFDHLVEDVVPMLCRFPLAGRSFLERSVRSNEALAGARKLRSRLRADDDLRELIVDDYLILYVSRARQIVFLAIKHHRQLSFDLKRFWQE